MSDTCAPNKCRSDGISDLGKIWSCDCGKKIGNTKQNVCQHQLVLFRDLDRCQKAQPPELLLCLTTLFSVRF